MEVVADLHLHSKYSRAVSSRMVVEEMAKWAKKKGIDLVGTADWTHPLWLKELESKLIETAPGLYTLKSAGPAIPSTSEVKFLLATEIASIYSQGGKMRRIHNLILAPSFATVKRINAELSRRGVNLMSDGRPITGISSRDLVALILEIDENCLVISAHAWTPWFSLYGSKSGFDSIKECYRDMAKYIYAIETGLSSSPAMNWRIKELDKRSILSFSDAHSPEKMGREATVFKIPKDLEISYEVIRKAITGKGKGKEAGMGKVVGQGDLTLTQRPNRPPNLNQKTFPYIAYTIEFYPEEGKYHYTGHRNCGVRQSPEETEKLGATCPVCGKPLTVGVMHRVQQLAGREIKPPAGGEKPARPAGGLKIKDDDFGARWVGYQKRPPYVMLVPLMEVIAEAQGSTTHSQRVMVEYERLVARFGSEFEVLLKTEIEKIAAVSGPRIAEAVQKVRQEDLVVKPGYDGVFGEVKIWRREGEEGEEGKQKQMSLF